MPQRWTSEQVLALSPDSSSTKAAGKLNTLSKWSALGKNDAALWGLCKGSGKNPYQTRIDLSEPAFKCSCPSRKFPCKHGLALFLLFVEKANNFTEADTPDWVNEWLETRQKRAASKAQKAEVTAKKEADPKTAQKRTEKRENKVKAGLKDLEVWLYDLIRQGIADVQSKPYSFWEQMAARMVDAQAPGIARMLREMPSLIYSSDWSERVLEKLGLLHLLLEAYKNLNQLSPDMQAEIRSLIGWTQSQEELLNQESTSDTWLVLGQSTTDDERLRVQRSWLWGEASGRYGLILNFAHGGAAFDANLMQGTRLEAELVFFSGLAPQRALIKSQKNLNTFETFRGYKSIDTASAGYAETLAKNPWLSRFPMSVENVRPVLLDEQWIILDQDQDSMVLSSSFEKGWDLLALSGGHPLNLFGEWDGESLLPLNVSANGQMVRL